LPRRLPHRRANRRAPHRVVPAGSPCPRRHPALLLLVDAPPACCSAEEFLEVFGVEKEGFLALPKWKKTAAKKRFGLF